MVEQRTTSSNRSDVYGSIDNLHRHLRLLVSHVQSFIGTANILCSIGFIGGNEQFRYFFYIIGGVTVIYAILVGIFLPDSPVRAKFLNKREKAIAIDRIRANQTGVENKVFKKEQMIEAFMDPKTWLMFFFNIFISMPNGGLTNVSIYLSLLHKSKH